MSKGLKFKEQMRRLRRLWLFVLVAPVATAGIVVASTIYVGGSNPALAATTCTALPTAYGSAASTINVASAATYRIWSRIMAPDSVNNSYFFQIDNDCGVVQGDSPNITANTWTWINYKDGASTSFMDVALTAGSHTLTVVGREPGVKLDRILLLSDITCVPTGLGDNCSSSDTISPTVSITLPANGENVSGVVNVAAAANDNIGVTKVDFLVDGNINVSDTAPPYSFSWNTVPEGIGTHTLLAQATDAAGNVGTSEAVIVNRVDTGVPTVSLTSPVNGAALSGTTTVTAVATDNLAVSHVDFLLDGVTENSLTTAPYTYSWDTTLVSNGSHTFRAVAFDASGNAGATSTITVTVNNGSADSVPPTAPSLPTATAGAAAGVDLTWTGSTDNVAVTGYKIKRGGNIIAEVGASSTSYSDASTQPNTTYTYTIVASDAAGNMSPDSDAVTVTTAAAVDTQSPTAPANLTATAASGTVVNLGWTESTDNVGVSQYTIVRDQVVLAQSATASWSDTTAHPGTTYVYKVFATDAAGNNSPASNEVSVQTPAPQTADTQAPSVPTNLSAVAASTRQVNLLWDASTDNVGVAGYYIERDGSRIATVTAKSYGDGAVSPHTAYVYTVAAFDAAGNVSATATARATTPANDPTVGTDLVENSTFEFGLSGWKLFKSTRGATLKIVTKGHTGSYSAQLSRTKGEGDVGLNDSPNWADSTNSGNVCKATAWVKGKRDEKVSIRLREYKDGRRIGSHTSSITLPDKSWHKIRVSASVKGGSMDLNIIGKDFESGDKLLIDDVTERCN